MLRTNTSVSIWSFSRYAVVGHDCVRKMAASSM